MAQKTSGKTKKKFPWLVVLAVVLIGGAVVTVGGFVFAANMESHDSFCASCHSQPESAYYERSTAAQPTDLASFHTSQHTACIECHSGPGVTGRIAAELMGAYNAAKWYTGSAVQPAQLKFPISDANCLKCHGTITSEGYVTQETITLPNNRRGREGREGGEFGNHWHQRIPEWQAAAGKVGSCLSCHSAHTTSGTAQGGFMEAARVQTECNACHQAIRRED